MTAEMEHQHRPHSPLYKFLPIGHPWLSSRIVMCYIKLKFGVGCSQSSMYVCMYVHMYMCTSLENTDTVHRQSQCHQTNQEPVVSQKVKTH